jgi:manganese efflux pump family protein
MSRLLQNTRISAKLSLMNVSWPSMFGIAVGLALDAFAVSIIVGLTLQTVTPRHVFRLAFHFGLFQFSMPVIGWLIGEELAVYVNGFGSWVAFLLLAFVGGKMLWESRRSGSKGPGGDPTRGTMLMTLSVATSVDALAVGMSMALWGVSVWMPSVVIGIVTAALTVLGIRFGGRLGARWSHWAEIIGGSVLILIGVRMLWGSLL